MKHFTTALLLPAAALLLGAAPPPSPEAVAEAALKAAPVWDGHNDVPGLLRERRGNVLGTFDFHDTRDTADPAKDQPAFMTDLNRLRAGRVGAQFWSVYVSASLTEQQAVQAVIEQVDVTRRLIARDSEALQYCADSACVAAAQKARRIASLLGAEGGHSIGSSLAVLRQLHALGVRYMTLTHSKNNGWADSATDAPMHDGLTPFGEQVVREMQRLGMLVDLSHVSEATMLDVLALGGPPVIASHSNARAVNGHARNIPDSALDAIKANGGIVMVNFYPPFVVEAARQWEAQRAAEEARLKSLNRGDPALVTAALAEWDKAQPMPRGTIGDVADHLDHIAKRIGHRHVGLGGDLDGIGSTVAGLEDASRYPALFVELARRGWTQAQLEMLASRNMMRILKAAEAYAAAHQGDPPGESPTTF